MSRELVTPDRHRRYAPIELARAGAAVGMFVGERVEITRPCPECGKDVEVYHGPQHGLAVAEGIEVELTWCAHEHGNVGFRLVDKRGRTYTGL